jgi:hypothetical protein
MEISIDKGLDRDYDSTRLHFGKGGSRGKDQERPGSPSLTRSGYVQQSIGADHARAQ